MLLVPVPRALKLLIANFPPMIMLLDGSNSLSFFVGGVACFALPAAILILNPLDLYQRHLE